MTKYLLLIPLVVALTACGEQNKVDGYTDAAVRACGKGEVAYVNTQEGRQ